jgi:hypothetical protein
MSNELEVYEGMKDMVVARPPELVLAEAKKAATALKDVVATKHKPVVFNGEQYLEFEDWQTVGRFYGVTAKIITTEFVDFGDAKGFLAKAVAIRTDGMEVSAAEAMCLNDEGNWKSKPLFQLRSMAQTRACAKALRNVLAWVVVLAGYRPTPAEEMHEAGNNRPPVAAPQKKAAPTPSEVEQIVNVKLNSATSKDGEKNGKKYTVYSIIDENSEKYATFDTKLFDMAGEAIDTGAIVAIKYVVGKFGNKITGMELSQEQAA